MKPTEVVILVRAIAAMCPAQKLDEYTADAWHPLLDDIRIEDARVALVNLGKVKAFIAPSDIRSEVADIRSKRLKENPMPEPAPGLTVPEYLEWLRAGQLAIADGRMVTGPHLQVDPATEERVLKEIGGGTFRTIPGESA